MGKLDCRNAPLITDYQIDRPEPNRQWKVGAVQGGSHCDRTLPVAMFADILPPSAQLAATGSSALGAYEPLRPTPLKQIRLAGFFCLEQLPELLEAHPFLLAHVRRHLSSLQTYYHFYCPINRTISWGLLTYHDNHIFFCICSKGNERYIYLIPLCH